jgi:hypothetical protein
MFYYCRSEYELYHLHDDNQDFYYHLFLYQLIDFNDLHV